MDLCLAIVGVLMLMPSVESVAGDSMSFTPTNQLVAKGSTFTMICKTPPKYLDQVSFKAIFTLFHNGQLIKEFRTRPDEDGFLPGMMPNDEAQLGNFSLVPADSHQTLGVKYEKLADLEDGGVYKCLLNNGSSLTANLTIVEGDASPVFVEKGSPAKFSCLVASSLNGTDLFDCRWYINGEKSGDDCTSLVVHNTGLSVPDVMCKVSLRLPGEATGGVSAVTDHSTVTFNKSLAVLSCDQIPRTAQPKRVICRVRGAGMQLDPKMRFFDINTSLNSSCKLNTSLDERTCEVLLTRVGLATVIVEHGGKIMLNIPLVHYMDKVTQYGPDGGHDKCIVIVLVGVVIVGTVFMILFTGWYYRQKRQWWWLEAKRKIQKFRKWQSQPGNGDVGKAESRPGGDDIEKAESRPGGDDIEKAKSRPDSDDAGKSEQVRNGPAESV